MRGAVRDWGWWVMPMRGGRRQVRLTSPFVRRASLPIHNRGCRSTTALPSARYAPGASVMECMMRLVMHIQVDQAPLLLHPILPPRTHARRVSTSAARAPSMEMSTLDALPPAASSTSATMPTSARWVRLVWCRFLVKRAASRRTTFDQAVLPPQHFARYKQDFYVIGNSTCVGPA